MLSRPLYRPRLLITALFVATSLMTCSATTFAAKKYDLLIRGGRVVDGTGAPWYEADVAVAGGKIAAIGKLRARDAHRVVDAKGLIVAPGFVDMMGQTATPMMEDPSTAENLLRQGITTINAGEGSSEAPLDDERAAQVGWQNMAEYFQMLELKGLPVNVVQTVGHSQIRRLVIGEEDRRPTDEELDAMREHVREAMQAGAIGVSTALIYPPAVYGKTDEIAALAEVAGHYGGRYYTHMRNEGDELLAAIDEALAIGRQGGTPVHIYHLKAAGKHNWGKMQLAIAKIKEARAEGHQVTADIYPYDFNGLGLEALIHPRHFAKGKGQLYRRLDDAELQAEIRKEMEETDGWENWYRHAGSDWNRVLVGNTSNKKYAKWVGQSVAAIAKESGEEPWDVFFELVPDNTFAMPITMSEANIIRAMQEEFVSFCTDVGPASESRSVSHPRSHGAFPKLFSCYVRDLGAISLERAVAQASAVAANEVLAYDRGKLAVGLAADIIAFDYDTFADTATPAEPRKMPEGMKYVVVNGKLVLDDGKTTDHRPGRVLRGPGYKAEKAPYQLLTGKRDDRLESIDRVVQEFMKQHSVPGCSLAITENGRLVYSRGFGYSDIAAGEQVEPTDLFRIASVSKPITALAIMQLVDEGKLTLDTPVFDILTEYEPHLEEGAKFDERQNQITIRHLLDHRGGWDRDVSFDGMFQSVRFARALDTPPPAEHNEIIRAMMGLPLDFNPGERYAYSNYGYCLLGRVIEKLTGQKYDDYVKEHVLAPVGVTDMVIGATHLEGRKNNEVRYYDPNVTRSVYAANLHQRVPSPYGAWYLESMDSHGAWIASAIDLVRIADSLNDAENCPLLKSESVELLCDRPEGLAGYDKEGKKLPTYYGLGWQITSDADGKVLIQEHGGALPGTNTKLVRRSDGRNYALLFNSRVSPTSGNIVNDMAAILNRTLDDTPPIADTNYYDDYKHE
ncbi:serine hydrolase [Aeoliella sp. SH292]|uniref:serine hydrolase n=1 Tax=Aeoliella sp. SH292 TaxID=3454464 RepID=UPI003F973586